MSGNAFVAPLLEDTELEALFSPERVFQHFLRFEIALTRARMALRMIDPDHAQQAIDAIARFEPDPETLRDGFLTDGVAIPAFVQDLKAGLDPSVAKTIHTGATSQDLVDTAMCLALVDAQAILAERLRQVVGALQDLDDRFGSQPMMARTRMQAALEITVSDRIKTWLKPLQDLMETMSSETSDIGVLQFGGPVGDRRGFDGAGDDVADLMATELRLRAVPCWHTDRRRFADHAHQMASLTTALGKLGQDITLMAQQGIDEVQISAAGGSSAMPHKRNPVRAEWLVTFAQFNAGQLGLMNGAAIHEQERSGAAWTLEWMVLPMMVQTTGRALAIAGELLGSIEHMGAR